MNTSATTTNASSEIIAPAHEGPTDDALMAAIQRGDSSALKAFYQRHHRVMKSIILRTVHDDATADDVLQDCLLNVWNQCRSYSPEKGKPLAWVVTLCRRRAIDALRRSMAYCHAKERMEQAVPQMEYDEHSAMENEHNDMVNVLEKHLALLPAPQQEVIRLAFINGMSQREVASRTHTPLGTVKTRIELGLKKLRQTLRTRSSIPDMLAA
ncbi:MAG: RNA polymerase sigma factor [Prosthecobacter sp.]